MWLTIVNKKILVLSLFQVIVIVFTDSAMIKYEHPYPPGYKSCSKTKPIRIEEFEPEKAWWNNREENESAWRVTAETIKAANYNLDIKNPTKNDEDHGDPEALLAKYKKLIEAVLKAMYSN